MLKSKSDSSSERTKAALSEESRSELLRKLLIRLFTLKVKLADCPAEEVANLVKEITNLKAQINELRNR
jgi:hypothetical protein